MLGKHDPSIKGYNPPLQNELFPTFQYDAAYLYDMLRLTYSCLLTPHPLAFTNPVLPAEDLSRGWAEAHLTTFLLKLRTCIDDLGEGILADTESKSVDCYRRVFGDDFPSV
jgi:hypothetical protein